MAVSDKMMLTTIRLRLNGCMPCRYGEPTTECDDRVHNLLIQVRDIIEGGQEATQHTMIEADLNEMEAISGVH